MKYGPGPTLNDLFPGSLGRLRLSTVVLRLQRPELLNIPMDQPLNAELATELRVELEAMKERR